METVDPLVALRSTRLPERAAAARDLAKIGTPDVVPQLILMAQNDRSPGVRLTVASAAADILSRYRAGPLAPSLPLATRRELLGLLRALDPGINPGLFSVLAATGLPEALSSIKVGLRDPRSGVRVGAAVGLTRMCMSVAAQGDQALEKEVVELLSDIRLPPDSLAEVARICAAVGYQSARGRLERLLLSGVHGEVVAAAQAVLDTEDAPLQGGWRSDGRDAGEVNLTPSMSPAFLAAGPAGILIATEQGWVGTTAPVRRLFIRRVGEAEPGPALQLDGRTWYRATDVAVLEAVELMCAPERLGWEDAPAPGAVLAAQNLAPALDGGGPELRGRGLLLLRAGHLAEARVALEAATESKRAPPDTWFLLAELFWLSEDRPLSRPHYESFLKKEKRKKAAFVDLAQARLAALDA